MNKGLLVLGAVVIIVLGVSAGIYIGQRNQPTLGPEVALLYVASDCRVTEARCEAGGRTALVSMVFEGPVTPMATFGIDVGVSGIAPERISSVRVAFEMQGMDMGENRYVLRRTSASADASDWHAQAMLPVCTTGRRDWLARVSVVAGDEEYRAEFPFTASALR